MAFEFNIDESQGEFEAFPKFLGVDHSEDIKEAIIALHSARSGTPIAQVRDEILRIGDSFHQSSARGQGTIEVNNIFQQEVKEAVEVSSLPSIQEAEKNRSLRQEVVDSTEAPEVVAGSQFDEISTRTLSREIGTIKIIDEVLDAAEATTLSIIVDVLDLFVSAPIDAIKFGGFGRADAANRLRALLSADISDEEYYTEVRKELQNAADAGWLQNENFLFLSGFAANIEEQGLGTTAALERFGNTIDLGFVASGLLSMLRTTTSMVSKIRGPVAAKRVLGDALNNPDSVASGAAGVPEFSSTIVNRHPLPNNGHMAWVADGADVAQEAEQSNRFLEALRSLPFFKQIDPELIEAFKPIGTQRLIDSVGPKQRRTVLDVSVNTDNSSNIFGTITYGTTKGTPFVDPAAAQRLADKLGPDAVVLPPINRGGQLYYQVAQTKNLSGVGLVDPLDATEIGRSFFRAFGGTFLAIPPRLDALAKGGESTLTNVAQRIAPIIKRAPAATNKGEVDLVEKVFYELRDGERLSHRRTAMSLSEFRTEWSRHSATPPSKAAEELYTTIQELNDALYFLKADTIFKRVVDEGTEVLKFRIARKDGVVDDWSLLVKGIDKDTLPEGAVAYSVETGVEATIQELSRTSRVFAPQQGYKVGDKTYRYVTTDDPMLRRVYHSDVLGYNPGGTRGYKDLNYYVKQDTVVDLVGEGQRAGRARTFMGTATRKEAILAAEQVNGIFIAFRKAIPSLENLSQANAIDAIRGLVGDAGLEAVIRSNNTWNGSIEGVGDMIDFMLKHRLDPRKNIGFAASEDALAVVDDLGRPVFGGRIGETYGERFESIINQPRNTAPRRDEPLIGFGGDFAETLSPIDRMQTDLVRATHNLAYQAYNFRAVRGWLAGAEDFITNKGALSSTDPLAAMKLAEFGKVPGPEARAYMDARSAMLRTIGNRSEAEVKWNARIDRVSEFIHDKVGPNKVSEILRNPGLAKSPLEFLRAMTFDVRLGLLDPGQLIVQSSQTFNILAILGPLKTGTWLQAAATHLPLRLAMRSDDPVIWKEIGRRAALFIGMETDEFVELARFTKGIGRLNVGSEVAELSSASMELVQSKWKQARNLTRVFFNEGEKMPRSAALSVAWKEYRTKFPGGDPFSDSGTRWIVSRQDALTAAMTSKSAAAWQRGPMSVPLQFMTYSARMLESIFTDRLLSKTERIRLASAQVVFWGAAGTGLGKFLDAYVIENGLDMSEVQYTLLRTGALDAALQWSTGTQARFGDRLAMAEGFTDLLDNAFEGEFLEILGGPGGQFATDIGSVMFAGFGDIVAGRTSLLESDIKKLFRNLTGPNKLYQAWMMYTVGDYLSRQDDVVVSGLTKTDALLALFGGQIKDANLAYTRLEVFRDMDARLKEHGAKIRQFMREMDKALDDRDFEGALEIQRQIGVYNGVLPPWQQTKLKKFYQPQLESLAQKTLNKLIYDRGGLLLEAAQENTIEEGD